MRLIPLIILATLASGCGNIEIFDPQGHLIARETTVLKDVTLNKFNTDGHGNITIEGGVAKVNADATRNVMAGAVEGFVRAWK